MILGVVSTLPAFFLDWFAIGLNWSRLKYLTKPLALVVLMGWFALENFSQPHPGPVRSIVLIFFAGQVFSLAGDILLLLPGRYFLWGLVAFLAAHLCFIASLQGWLAEPTPLLLSCAIMVAVGSAVYFRRLYQCMRNTSRSRRLVIAVAIYIAAISLMMLSALSTFFQPGWQFAAASLAALGGLFFFCSDGLLAYNKFVGPVAHGRLKVRVLYHLGQLGLALGLTLQLWLTYQQ